MKNLLFILCFSFFQVQSQACPPETFNDNTNIQIALLLDTSGSMSGLIEQAKAQLWNIANDITNYEKNGEETYFQIALYEYGKDEIAASEGYIRQLVPFTTDMDRLSEVLFALKTNGGSEYCGLVIHKSLEELKWEDETSLKVIYIAGNESFAQGQFPYQKACKEAKQKNVIINTIYCGPKDVGISLEWNTGAVLAKGDFHNIDHNEVTVHVDSPYDADIIRLNNLLNSTYIYFGHKGKSYRENMSRQDVNAKSFGMANYAKRSIYKSKSQYSNSTWDLIDAYQEDNSIVKEASHLPKEYSDLSGEELEQLIIEKMEERKKLQIEIACLAKERENFISEHLKNNNQTGLGNSILDSLAKKMESAGFKRK